VLPSEEISRHFSTGLLTERCFSWKISLAQEGTCVSMSHAATKHWGDFS
jgi:hypothetical protein